MPYKNKCDKNANSRAWRATNRETVNGRARKIHASLPSHKRTKQLLQQRDYAQRKYGLTFEGKHALLTQQGNRCAVCRTDTPILGRGGKPLWHTDHCHETGKVRGVLCSLCNTGIGALGDNTAGLRDALEYLVRFEMTN